VFAAVGRGEDDKEEGSTAVLYPHCRIQITELVKAGPTKIVEVELQTVEPPTPPPSPPSERQIAGPTTGMFRFLVIFSAPFLTYITRSCTDSFLAQTRYLNCQPRESYHLTL
jgi:hypothetical protein